MDKNSEQAPDIRKLVSDNKYFIWPFIFSFVILLVFWTTLGNNRMFLFVNNIHSGLTDVIFLNLTNLGDGAVAFILVVILLWVSYRDSLTFLIITILITIIVTILKNYVFREFDRPLAYFGTTQVIRLVSGYDPPVLCSFPSGHSATAFSVYLYLAILSKNQMAKFGLFIVAFFVAYSRIYLSAHFPQDAMAGAFIAVFITLLCYYWSRQIKGSGIDKKLEFGTKIFVKHKSA